MAACQNYNYLEDKLDCLVSREGYGLVKSLAQLQSCHHHTEEYVLKNKGKMLSFLSYSSYHANI